MTRGETHESLITFFWYDGDMARTTTKADSPAPTIRPSFWEGVRDIDAFFEGRDQVHKSMRRLIKRLEKANISYVIAGGMAVKAQGYRRTTKDVDVLLTREGFAEFNKRYVPKNYLPTEGRSRRMTDRTNQVSIDFLIAGMYPGRGQPGPIAFPDPSDVGVIMEDVRVLDLVTLIMLKLAARRHQDFADVVNLISVHKLDEAFLPRLHKSQHSDFIECLEEKRREDEYIDRNG